MSLIRLLAPCATTRPAAARRNSARSKPGALTASSPAIAAEVSVIGCTHARVSTSQRVTKSCAPVGALHVESTVRQAARGLLTRPARASKMPQSTGRSGPRVRARRSERNASFWRYASVMERSTPLSGRRAQAARNDRLILEAARSVFVADPEAPISAVAERAGVGISALYRRYASKEDLLRHLCLDGLQRYIGAAVADEGDPWNAFATFMRRVVEADTPSLTNRLAGTYTPDEELYREAARAQE